MIKAGDSLVHFSSMTSKDIVRRHMAISHQVYASLKHIRTLLIFIFLQKPLFAYTKTGRTVQLHSPSVYEYPPASFIWRLSEPGMAWYDPRTNALAVRCAEDTLLVVPEVWTR